MSDSPSLASVVHVTFRTWQKVPDGHLLALFHRRFWGKSMEDEEEEWQKAQPQIEGQPEDEDEDRYEGEGRAIDEDDNEAMEVQECEGKGKGRAIDEDDNEAMEEDELEGEAMDDDDIPGCYPFSVGIEDITVWIRADYIRIYEALQDYYEKTTKQSGRTPSAVVTGQPGIGESRYFASST